MYTSLHDVKIPEKSTFKYRVIQLIFPNVITILQQSLCSEMAEELRFAVRCHGSRQRPALKRSCTRCSPGTTYVPAALEMPHINGVSEYLQRSKQPKNQTSSSHYSTYHSFILLIHTTSNSLQDTELVLIQI